MTDVIAEIEFDGSKIAEARGSKTQTELAAEIGISKQALWQIENGKTKPQADVLVRICAALNIPIDQLAK